VLFRAALGEMADSILQGQRAVPRRLQELGFQFRFPELAPALADLL
jgi:NAD dependent epimerase/dehydratase family enzyme